MQSPIRACIVDDHPGVRAGLRNLLSAGGGIQVVGEAADGNEAIQLGEQLKPDIILLDVELPVMRGDLVAKRLKQTVPEVKLLAVSSYNDPAYVQAMLDNGAEGYITKDEVPNQLIRAVQSLIYKQLKWISPNALKKITSIHFDHHVLTSMELNILISMLKGESDSELTKSLIIDQESLEQIITRLFEKFNVHTREDLLSAAKKLLSTSPT